MAYQPAANTGQSAALQHQANVIYYKKVGLDKLYKTLRFQGVCEPDEIPQRSGRTVQWFRFDLLGGNTVPSSEGVVGTGVPLSSNVITATVDQYSDFTSLSTFLQASAINSMVQEASEQMSYRAALTVDGITRAEIDSNVADATVGLSTVGSYLGIKDFHKATSLLRGKNVQPKEGSDFVGVIHPYNVYDLITDTTAGGYIDALKYQQGTTVLNGEVGKVGSVRLLTSTNVGDDGVAATNTKYYVYIFGKGGVGAVALAGKGPSNVSDPKSQMFNLNVIPGGANPADPEGQIGTYVSYFFIYTAKTLDSTNFRYCIVKADSSIV